jgi:hypothetical protein
LIVNLLEDYFPHRGQVPFHRSRARFRNLLAGRRFGKDYCGAREFIKKMVVDDYPSVQHLKLPTDRFIKYTKPLLHYWCVAPDFNVGKIQQREIFSIFPPEFQASRVHFNYDDNKKELRILGNRVLVEFKSADRPDTLVGVGLNGIYCTEFARFKETAWQENLRPTLSDKRGWGIFTSTPLPRKWYVDFCDLGDPTRPNYQDAYENFRGKTVDNTRLIGIEEEVELARKTMPIKYFMRNYEASLDCFDGQVYEEWYEQTHCPRPFVRPRFDIVIAGVDWGYAQPGAIVVVGVAYLRGLPHFYLIDEVYEKGILLDGEGETWIKTAHRLKSRYNIQIFYCDTAEPGYIRAFRNKGLNAVGADKDVTDGIQSVATVLHVSETTGQPRFIVDADKCQQFIKNIVPYQFGPEEKPLDDQEDHDLDATRYAVHTFLRHGGVLAGQTTDEPERY